MDDARREEKSPPAPPPATPDEPQSSVHAQTVGPESAAGEAPREGSERTLAEESERRRHSEAEGEATEERRDEV